MRQLGYPLVSSNIAGWKIPELKIEVSWLTSTRKMEVLKGKSPISMVHFAASHVWLPEAISINSPVSSTLYPLLNTIDPLYIHYMNTIHHYKAIGSGSQAPRTHRTLRAGLCGGRTHSLWQDPQRPGLLGQAIFHGEPPYIYSRIVYI